MIRGLGAVAFFIVCMFGHSVGLRALAGDHVAAERPDFWSLRPIKRHAPPNVNDFSAVRTAVDCFVLSALEEKGLSFSPPATPHALIRRAYFDLVGLPPPPDRVRAFVADYRHDAELAYSRLVDQLLASPHYGERWGRHWLDVAGYSDSNGFITDSGRPEAWKYRDYVIRSLNENKPFDEFLIEQFAGDQLVDWRVAETWSAETIEKLTATGFLRCTPDGTDNQTMFQLDKRWDRLLTAMETALKAAIGINFNCVRCHDSKYDPFSQEDYYGLLAAFQPAYSPGNWIAANDRYGVKWPVRYLYVADRSTRESFAARASVIAERLQENKRQVKELQQEYFGKWLVTKAHEHTGPERQRLLAALRMPADDRDEAANQLVAEFKGRFVVSDDVLSDAFPEFKRLLGQLNEQYAREEKVLQKAEPEQRIWALWDLPCEQVPVTRVLYRGDFQTPGEAVEFSIPAALSDPSFPFPPVDEAADSNAGGGRRLTLARWITHENHPLTSRVIVNRVWQYHFGRAIVGTPDDFGFQGERPSHPELLDWLAAWVIDHGWNIKDLHRLIMRSRVYRQSSDWDEEKAAVDPLNRLWWRRDRKRLEAEAIRDAMLVAAGSLDRSTLGRAVRVRRQRDGQWMPDPGDVRRYRRSIYLEYKRNRITSILRVFDAPDYRTNEPHRFVSTVPLQSLSLLNNPLVHEAAARLAERLIAEQPSEVRKRLDSAFAIAFGRRPTEGEVNLCCELVGDDPANVTGWRTLAQGLLAANEFLYLD